MFDEEDPPVPSIEETPLDWRLDPDHSFSDWKIEIYCEDEGDDETTTTPHAIFNIHRPNLTFGPGTSHHFLTLFRSHSVLEASTKTSRIKLPRLAAEAFPDFLDFAYGGRLSGRDDDLRIWKMTPLHSLADRLGNDRLKYEMKKCFEEVFADGILARENLPIFYQQAKLLNNNYVRKLVISALSKEVYERQRIIHESDPMLNLTDASFWLEVLQAGKGKEIGWSPSNSTIMEIVRHYPDMTAEVFVQLTAEIYLPIVLFSDAVALLKLEESIVGSGDDAQKLSSLQERCLMALSESKAEEYLDDEGMGFICHRPELASRLFSKKREREVLYQNELELAQRELKRCKDECEDWRRVRALSDITNEPWCSRTSVDYSRAVLKRLELFTKPRQIETDN